MARPKHHTAAHDDETWMGFFRRWHEGEDSRALYAEAKVSGDTFHVHAKRLKMRLKDLPEGHPARRRSLPYDQRGDEYREPNGLLAEGVWKALFALRAQGVPDTVLGPRFGVATTVICNQARRRGLRREDLRRAGVEAGLGGETVSPPPSRPGDSVVSAPPPPAEARAVPLPSARGGLVGDFVGPVLPAIDPESPERTRAAIKAQIAEMAEQRNYRGITEACEADAAMDKFFQRAEARGRPHPVGGADHPPRPGEGEAVAPLILRPQQRPPEGDWSTWLFLGGRGAGKTLAGASWISDMAERCGRLALIGATLHDAREVMIGGPSGILNLPRWRVKGEWPVYQASRRRLVFPNGAEAFVFSAEDPDSLRGPQFAAAWADEFCAWRDGGEVLPLLRMGLRLTGSGAPGANARLAEPRCLSAPDEDQAAEARWIPRLMVTTTPRPTAALKALRAEASCKQSHAPTADNAENLAPAFLEGLQALYGGTRRAAQELEGLVVEPEGGLFTAEMLVAARLSPSPEVGRDGEASAEPGWGSSGRSEAAGVPHPDGCAVVPPHEGEGEWDKVVVAVDPTTTAAGNACGIVVVARAGERAVVLADRSARGLSPEGWARRALAAASEFGAAEIVAEVNQGGEMVRAVLEAAGLRGSGLRFRPVRATSGKRARAEPVAALYEQGRVRHAGVFSALEEELMAFGSEDEGRYDLDRADALVWGVTALLLGARGEGPRIRTLDFGVTPRGLSVQTPWPAEPAWG